MTKMSTIDAREKFSDLIHHVTHNNERVILTRRGKDIAAIVPLDDLHYLEKTQDKHDLKDAIDSLKEVRSSGAIPLEKFKEEIS